MAYLNGKEILFSPIVNIAEGGTIVDSPLPIEVATEAEMTAKLDTAQVGSVYKYVGESTDTYEKDGLYIVEEVVE